MKHNEFNELADELEAACGDWENSDGLSEKALKELIAKVEAMDAEAEKKNCPKPERKRRRLKKRYVFLLAAALMLAMGTGVVGDRVWRSDSKDLERVSEITTKVDNEDKTDILREEESIYQEIAEKLGITPMRLGYKPDGMELDSYSIGETTGWANINYLYNGNLVCIQMAKRTGEFSSNVQWDGDSRKIENISNVYGYDLEAYCVDEENHNYGASILYGNGYYNIFGVFEEEQEFLSILNQIFFKNV